jgi:hypothetical protein
MKKLNSKLFAKYKLKEIRSIYGGSKPTGPTSGYDSDCVIDTDCPDGGTGADVMRGECCEVAPDNKYTTIKVDSLLNIKS